MENIIRLFLLSILQFGGKVQVEGQGGRNAQKESVFSAGFWEVPSEKGTKAGRIWRSRHSGVSVDGQPSPWGGWLLHRMSTRRNEESGSYNQPIDATFLREVAAVTKPIADNTGAKNRRGKSRREPERCGEGSRCELCCGLLDDTLLADPPVYRRFLAGGDETLEPGWLCWLALLIAGAGLMGIGWALWTVQKMGPLSAFVSTSVGGLVCSVIVVLLVSRWLGSRLGLLTGFVWLSSATVLGAHLNTWLAVVCCAAVGLFAVAEVPGRLDTVTHGTVRWGFFALLGVAFWLFGPMVPVAIIVACLGFIVLHQNAHSIRFLLNPIGLSILVLAVGGRWLARELAAIEPMASGGLLNHTGTSWDLPTLVCSLGFALGVVPWLLFAMVGLGVGIWQGHYAVGFWQFVGCWIVTAGTLAAVGLVDGTTMLAMVSPPCCFLAAVGLELATGREGWIRRLGKTRRPSAE